MEIIEEFGVNPILLAAQVINFIIILVILKRFLYKPVLGIIKKRESIIKKGLEDAESAQKLLEKTAEDERKVLQKASERAEKLVEETKLQTQEMLKLAEVEAKRRTEKMLSEASSKIDDEIKNAKKELTRDLGRVSVEILEKALDGLIGRNDQKQVIDKAIKNIKPN